MASYNDPRVTPGAGINQTSPLGASAMDPRASVTGDIRDGDVVATDETATLIASDKVEGTAVYDRGANRLGTVRNVMIDKRSGQVAYVIISFGGFLGIGEQYHPLPWKSLTYDRGMGGYVVDISRDQLEAAPHYAADEEPWGDPGYGRQVDEYYGLPYTR